MEGSLQSVALLGDETFGKIKESETTTEAHSEREGSMGGGLRGSIVCGGRGHCHSIAEWI